jgi:hypothetical protein
MADQSWKLMWWLPQDSGCCGIVFSPLDWVSTANAVTEFYLIKNITNTDSRPGGEAQNIVIKQLPSFNAV